MEIVSLWGTSASRLGGRLFKWIWDSYLFLFVFICDKDNYGTLKIAMSLEPEGIKTNPNPNRNVHVTLRLQVFIASKVNNASNFCLTYNSHWPVLFHVSQGHPADRTWLLGIWQRWAWFLAAQIPANRITSNKGLSLQHLCFLGSEVTIILFPSPEVLWLLYERSTISN